MKRSEMRNQISDNVISNFMTGAPLQLRNLIADCVLAEVEKYGMLPPQPYGEVVSDDVRDYRWEPEVLAEEESE